MGDFFKACAEHPFWATWFSLMIFVLIGSIRIQWGGDRASVIRELAVEVQKRRTQAAACAILATGEAAAGGGEE